jgi:hypothetical protein
VTSVELVWASPSLHEPVCNCSYLLVTLVVLCRCKFAIECAVSWCSFKFLLRFSMLILCFSIFQWLRLCYQFGLCSSFVLVFYHYYQLLICVWCKTTSSCCWFRYMHWNQGRQNGHPRIKSTGWTSIKSECLSPASGRMSPFALSHECNSSRNEQLNDYGNDWILSHLGHKWLLQCFWPWVIVDKSFIPF